MSPGRGFFTLAAVWFGLAALAVAWPAITPVWGASAAAVLALAWHDYRAARRRAAPHASRRIPASLALGVWNEIRLEIRAADGDALDARVFDHAPAGDDVAGMPVRIAVPAGGRVDLRYRYRPLVRGDRHFERCDLLVASPLGIWRRRVRCGAPDVARVFPNFSEVAKYTLLATDNRLSQIGIRKRPQRGEGMEFHQLREYRNGDGFRQIDWKASSRMGKWISREYQIERDQQIVLMLDGGRRMRTRDGEFTHFDHSLNAALLLAYVALRQGDLVGVLTFGGNHRQCAPRKGAGTLRTILETLYDVQPTAQSPDYLRVAQAAMTWLKKRSLVVMITNLRDEDLPEIVPAVHLLQRRHLVLLASLREAALGRALDRGVREFRDALTTAAVHRYLRERRHAHDLVRRHGVMTVDCEARALATGVVNRYLDIKRGGVL